jgi:hypothetical protein
LWTSPPKMEAVCSSETLSTFKSTRRYDSEHWHWHFKTTGL